MVIAGANVKCDVQMDEGKRVYFWRLPARVCESELAGMEACQPYSAGKTALPAAFQHIATKVILG